MTFEALAKILNVIAKTDPEGMRCEQALSWLAGLLRRHSGVKAVHFRLAEVPRQAKQPGPDALLLAGEDPPAGLNLPKRAGALSFFGKPAVLGDLRDVTHQLFRGPLTSPEANLAAEECCLMVRLRLETALCWALIFDGHGLARPEEIDSWVQALPGLVRCVLERLDYHNVDTIRSRRQRFYDALLEAAPAAPPQNFSDLCEAWKNVSGASWAWLWLYNQESCQCELTAYAPARSLHVLPAERETPGPGSVADYCFRSGEPVHVEDIAGWRGRIEGEEFKVICANSLMSMGCAAFDCIPLFSPGVQTPRTDPCRRETQIVGAVSLHYTRAGSRVPQPRSSLLLMGRLTALSIVNSFLCEQREILVELNDMVQRHLTRINRRPGLVRQEYLKHLIDLIKERLHVGAVSIFYRVPFGDAVECLATTGLRRPGGETLKPADLPDVVYNAQEGATGKVFATAQPMTIPTSDHAIHEGKFIEVPDGGGEEIGPVLVYPIPGEDSGAHPTACGVIRCGCHRAPLFPKHLRGFDPVEAQTLRFIAQQVGPVLQTLASRIQREQTISVVKHDLYAPLTMIRNMAERIARAVDNQEPIRHYDLQNLGVSHLLAQNLVAHLDINPGEVRDFSPSPTLLEGDIIARVRNMLGHYAEEENDMRIHFDNLREVPLLDLDRSLIERAVCNLLLNAVKYGRPRTTIEVQARAAEAGFYLDVINYGLGVEPDEEPHLFKPYYRSRRAQRRKHGLGLGLSIARHAMERHGGSLELTARKDPTVFTMFFPRSLISKSGRS